MHQPRPALHHRIRIFRVAGRPFCALAIFALGVFALTGCKTIPEGRSAINEVQIRGTDKVDEDDVLDKIATTKSPKFLMLFRGILFEYTLFDRFVLQRDLARVEAFYRSKGHYDVHARAGRIHRVDKNHVRVEIIVEEGEPVVVRSVHIDGLAGLAPEIVDAAKRAATEGLPIDQSFDEDEFTKTEGNIRRALTDNGYAYAKVKRDAAVDVVTHKGDVVFTVKPGPKCTFGTLRIEGLGSLPEDRIRRVIDIEPGTPYSEKVLEDAQQALLDLGVFAAVDLSPDIPGTKPNPPADPGAATAAPGEGEPGDATTEGSSAERTQDESDESKDSKNTKNTKNDANDAEGGAPAKEEDADGPGAAGPPEPGPPVVPILVKLEPSRLRTIRLGGGIEFDALKTDVHAVVGWENRNFLGGLRSFNVTFRPGVVLYPIRVNNIVAPSHFLPEERLRVDFKQPGFLEGRTNAFIRPEFNVYPVLIDPDPPPNANVIGYGELRNSIGLERPIWKLFGIVSHNTQVAYPFSYVGPRDQDLSLVVISYPELRTIFDFRDDKVHPSKGIYIENTFQVAGNIFGGNANDFKVQPELRAYLPLAKKKKVVFATRFTAGFLMPQNYGDIVRDPAGNVNRSGADRTKDYQLTFFRGFFSGGPSSNRGYPIRAVGPQDFVPFLTPEIQLDRADALCRPGTVEERCKSPTGGFTLWEASAEVRVNISGPLSAATFCDTSDVSPRTGNLRFNYLHLSCGAGGRYDTPAGPIRLDIGYRIPGMQVLGSANDLDPRERKPTDLFGIPIAVHIGIGEAY